MTNFVDKGLTQTDKDPALQGQFAFNFGPQFSLGLWGSNVSFPGEDEHLWLRPYAQINLNFSQNFLGKIVYSQHQFYKSTTRNGNTLALGFEVFKYEFEYDFDSNWEGTGQGDNYVSFGKTWDVFGNWKWQNKIGYSMLKGSYDNYFDGETFLGYNWTSLYLQGGLTLTSNPSEFNNGQGDFFILLKASTRF